MNARNQATGVDPRKMSPIYRQMLKQGIVDDVTFQPVGRDVVDLRYDENNNLVRIIYSATEQFVPYLGKTYEEMLVVDCGRRGDGVIIARTIPLNPYSEQFSTDEWLSDAEFLRRLQRSVFIEKGRKNDPVAFVDGRLVLLHERSLRPVMNAQNKVIIIESLKMPHMYVLSEEQVRQVHESTGSALATWGQALGLFSAAEQETVTQVLVKAKKGLHAASIRTDEGLQKTEIRVQIWDALGNPEVMGLAPTLSMDCSAEDLKAAGRKLLASVNTDSQGMVHPYITKMAPFKGSYVMRRAVEEKLSFFRRVGEKALKIAEGWKQEANLEGLPKDTRAGSKPRSRGGNRARDRRDNGGQAAATQQAPTSAATNATSEPQQPPTAPAVGEPAGGIAWDEPTGAGSPATDTATASAETAAADATGSDAGDSTDASSASTEPDPAMTAFKARLKRGEEIRAKVGSKPKAEKPKAERPVLKGLASLGALKSAGTSEGEGSNEG